LARNADYDGGKEYKLSHEQVLDPMIHVQALRSHIYNVNMSIVGDDKNNNNNSNNNTSQLELFERMKMVDLLNEFVANYRTLLVIKSTKFPFGMIQMGRTFLFLYTFSIPLVLRGVVSEMYSAIVFVFFLTYGFVGLEIVAMKLMSPFGESTNDLNIAGIRAATVRGIENDLQYVGDTAQLEDKRLQYSRQKQQPPLPPMKMMGSDDGNPSHDGDPGCGTGGSAPLIGGQPHHHYTSHSNVYHSMA